MTSLRHTSGPDDELLDVARDCLVAVGWRRTTLTDVARRAGVSRMTIYRRWPDMRSLLADLMTREWSQLAEDTGVGFGPAADVPPLHRLSAGVAAAVAALRENALFRKIVETDPELLLPYLLDRRGRTQDGILGLLQAAVLAGQKDGSVRAGDPARLARSVLLTAHGFALSAATMAEPGGPSVADLDAELVALIERYLAR
jgi:AcrR family transcriptional regulator